MTPEGAIVISPVDYQAAGGEARGHARGGGRQPGQGAAGGAISAHAHVTAEPATATKLLDVATPPTSCRRGLCDSKRAPHSRRLSDAALEESEEAPRSGVSHSLGDAIDKENNDASRQQVERSHARRREVLLGSGTPMAVTATCVPMRAEGARRSLPPGELLARDPRLRGRAPRRPSRRLLPPVRRPPRRGVWSRHPPQRALSGRWQRRAGRQAHKAAPVVGARRGRSRRAHSCSGADWARSSPSMGSVASRSPGLEDQQPHGCNRRGEAAQRASAESLSESARARHRARLGLHQRTPGSSPTACAPPHSGTWQAVRAAVGETVAGKPDAEGTVAQRSAARCA